MTAVGHVVKFMVIELGTLTEVECAVTSAKLTPSTATATTTTACPDGVITDAAPSTWAFDLGYNADVDEASLSTFLAEHEGETLAVQWTPDTTVPGRVRTFDVTVIPGQEDYTVGSWAAGSVSLPVRGKPAWTTTP